MGGVGEWDGGEWDGVGWVCWHRLVWEGRCRREVGKSSRAVLCDWIVRGWWIVDSMPVDGFLGAYLMGSVRAGAIECALLTTTGSRRLRRTTNDYDYDCDWIWITQVAAGVVELWMS